MAALAWLCHIHELCFGVGGGELKTQLCAVSFFFFMLFFMVFSRAWC